LLAVHEVSDLSPEEAMLSVANRTLYTPARMKSLLPPWMDKLESVGDMRAELLRLGAAGPSDRMRVDPQRLAGRLVDWARKSEPIQAVSHLRGLDRNNQARELL